MDGQGQSSGTTSNNATPGDSTEQLAVPSFSLEELQDLAKDLNVVVPCTSTTSTAELWAGIIDHFVVKGLREMAVAASGTGQTPGTSCTYHSWDFRTQHHEEMDTDDDDNAPTSTEAQRKTGNTNGSNEAQKIKCDCCGVYYTPEPDEEVNQKIPTAGARKRKQIAMTPEPKNKNAKKQTLEIQPSRQGPVTRSQAKTMKAQEAGMK